MITVTHSTSTALSLSLSLSLDRRLLFPFLAEPLAEEPVCSWRWIIIYLKLLFPSQIPLEWASVWGSEDALLFIDWSEPVSSGSIHHRNRCVTPLFPFWTAGGGNSSLNDTWLFTRVFNVCEPESVYRESIGCLLSVLTRQSRPEPRLTLRWICSGFWDYLIYGQASLFAFLLNEARVYVLTQSSLVLVIKPRWVLKCVQRLRMIPQIMWCWGDWPAALLDDQMLHFHQKSWEQKITETHTRQEETPRTP